MKNLLIRSLTGLVFVIILVIAIMYSKASTAAVLFIFSMMGLYEFYTLLQAGKHSPQFFIGLVFGLGISLISILPQLGIIETTWIFSIIPIVFVIAVPIVVLELFRSKDNPFVNLSITLFGWIYVILPFMLLFTLRNSPGANEDWSGYELLLGFFIILWTNDTGAYAFGSTLGKHKFFERISPKKTWEGFIGGGVAAVAAGIVYAYFNEFPLLEWGVMAGLIAVFGTMGDLSASLLKRSVGVKDSGNILPGHGGVLDRFDGVLLAAPIVFTYVLIFGKNMI